MRPHWSSGWLGRPYSAARYDCADFAADVVAARTGVRVRLPGRAASIRGRVAQMGAEIDHGLAATDAPVEGDIVLMRLAGRRGAGNHIGVWCAVAGVPHVLHLPAGAGSCLHPLDALAARGWEAVGVYRLTEAPDRRS